VTIVNSNIPLIQLKNLHKHFGKQKVLRGVHLSILKGQVTTIIGASGGGKSVLLKHIIGLLEPDEGQVLFQGIPLFQMTKKNRRLLKRKFSYMFQGMALFDSMSVYDNIALPLKERTRLSKNVIREKVSDIMTQLGLTGTDYKYPSQISGGMKKRVALARALITEPEIVLFDEPTTGLDPIKKNSVHAMISDYQRKFGFTAVVVSHDIPDIFYISQRIAMLYEGKILIESSPENIQHSPDPLVRQFINGQEKFRKEVDTLPQVEKRFEEAMVHLQRHEIAFSLVVLSVVNFDEILDASGYMAAQTVMERFTKKVREHLSITDTSSRYGMNELLLVMSNTTQNQARKFCARLSKTIRQQDILEIQPYPNFCFSVSAGFAEATKGCPFNQILSMAESEQNLILEFRVCD
jgi:phospholipid/cholesterol/gamma-HCH transport system ATP-binding protein